MPGSRSDEYALSDIFNLKRDGVWDDRIKDKSVSVVVNGNVTSTGNFFSFKKSTQPGLTPGESYILIITEVDQYGNSMNRSINLNPEYRTGRIRDIKIRINSTGGSRISEEYKGKINPKYLPQTLSLSDKKKQLRMLLKSRKMYKKGQYYTRKKVLSYKHKPSKHILKARKMYNTNILPSKELSRKTGCSVSALKQIVRKGEGAYYSSGSRPNQTPQSWGLARLASAITGGKASKVDYHIIEKGCNPKKMAFKLAVTHKSR
jgi:hypothetical protein